MRPIKLAFNATSLLSPLTGIGQYSLQLATGLAAREEVDVDFFYGTQWDKTVRKNPLPGASKFLPWVRKRVPYAYELRRFIQSKQCSARGASHQFDLYHEPNYLALPIDAPTVVTVHDLSWIRFPEMHPVERVRAMDKYFKPSLDSAALILTDSDFVQTELTDVFGVKQERMRTVRLGVEALFKPQTKETTQNVLGTHGLVHGQYLIAVGTLEPRKNLQVALRAFMTLPANLRQDFPLVIVGMQGWHTSELTKSLAPLIASGEVRQLGYLPREDLATVLAGATALVYPSIYEGFGLPPLEAMACGVPVIASNVSSIPEVVGDTGILIDPHDVEGLAKAMKDLLEHPDHRDELGLKALKRSATFSWERCVDQTVDAYRSVLSKS